MQDYQDELEIARPDSWKSVEMPSTMSSLPLERIYTAEEFSVIARGVVPEQMEDKWFIFIQEMTLSLHRSWTGFCVYKVIFKQVNGEYFVQEVLVNRDAEQYNSGEDSHEIALVGWLIDGLILRKQVSFPFPSNVSEELPIGAYQHHIAGTGFPEVQNQEEEKA